MVLVGLALVLVLGLALVLVLGLAQSLLAQLSWCYCHRLLLGKDKNAADIMDDWLEVC